jgi:hypothetical protein
MIRLMISAFAAVAFLAIATTVLRSHPHSIDSNVAAMPSLLELHAAAKVNKLPVQEVDDQSLIYPAAPRQ